MKYERQVRIIPERDYFRQVPTILNSEEAALIKVENLVDEVERGDMFVDPDFGPLNDTDFKGSQKALYFGELTPNGYPDPKHVVWRHIEETGEKTYFMENGSSYGQVRQGNLGDRWFLGALALIAMKKQLLISNQAEMLKSEIEVNA